MNGVAKGYDARLDVATVEGLTDAAKQRRPENTADLVMGWVQVDIKVADIRFCKRVQFVALLFPEHISYRAAYVRCQEATVCFGRILTPSLSHLFLIFNLHFLTYYT